MDNSAIQRIAKGDIREFESLYLQLSGALFYYAFKLCGEREQSEDFVQEVFVQYWENRAGFDNVGAVKVYLFSLLRNRALNKVRLEQNRKKLLDGYPAAHSEDLSLLMVTADIYGQLYSAIDDLPEQTGNVLRMSLQEMSVKDIAHELGISENTVKTLKKNGYRTLREKLSHLRILLTFLFP